MKKIYVFVKSEKQNIFVNKKMYFFLLKPYIFYFLFQLVIVFTNFFLVVVFYVINYDANKKTIFIVKNNYMNKNGYF
jgi:hypothetical protein